MVDLLARVLEARLSALIAPAAPVAEDTTSTAS